MDDTQRDESFDNHLCLETYYTPAYSETTSNTSGSEALPILQTIINHLDIFEQRIADSEYKLERTSETGQRIEELLNRQLMDGLISYAEFINLNHVKQLWISTSTACAAHNLGCTSSKKEILANLVDLFTLNEISREKLLDIAVEI